MKIFRNWTFRWWEIGLLKLGLISLGLILGIYLKSYLAGLVWLWWAIFAVTAAYFIGKLVQENESANHTFQSEAKSDEVVPKQMQEGFVEKREHNDMSNV